MCSDNQGTCWEYQKALGRQYKDICGRARAHKARRFMGETASNVIGSHKAPPSATLLHFFSKNIFRTLFFRTRSQKGTFKAFPTKWYTLSLFQSHTDSTDRLIPCSLRAVSVLTAVSLKYVSSAYLPQVSKYW